MRIKSLCFKMIKSEKDRELKDQILVMIEFVEKYTFGLSENEFYQNDLVKDACLMRLTIIRELAGKFSAIFKDENNKINWQEIKAARNFYVHQYGQVDWTTVWEVKEKYLSMLKNYLIQL